MPPQVAGDVHSFGAARPASAAMTFLVRPRPNWNTMASMRFDDRFLDEIKSRLRLSDVIGRTVKLRRQGREYAGLSPFTKEKSPSFFVNDDKGFYHCFSSGKHGDLISFLMETERLSFPEAVEKLANEAGVSMPAVDPRSVEEDKKRQDLSDWLDLAAKWFEAELRRPAGKEARAYLERRGLPESEWARFGVGLAPDSRTGLKDYLIAKGARPAELVEAGLLIAPEEGGKDPDEVLREQGPAALKAQIGKTEPFVERLFKAALEDSPVLETPEQKTAFKVRLRKLASTIADPELAGAYREDLLGRYEALWPTAQPVYTVGAAARELSRRRWAGKKGPAPITGATAQGKAAAHTLHASPKPLSAALALAAIEHPELLHDSLERVALSGFADEQLSLIANELVALSMEADTLDEASVRRRLSARGVEDSVFDQLQRAAGRARAAFMDPALAPAEARALWTRAFDALMELESLERAVDLAKQDVDRDGDFATLKRLKADRDLLSRAIGSGELWGPATTH